MKPNPLYSIAQGEHKGDKSGFLSHLTLKKKKSTYSSSTKRSSWDVMTHTKNPPPLLLNGKKALDPPQILPPPDPPTIMQKNRSWASTLSLYSRYQNNDYLGIFFLLDKCVIITLMIKKMGSSCDRSKKNWHKVNRKKHRIICHKREKIMHNFCECVCVCMYVFSTPLMNTLWDKYVPIQLASFFLLLDPYF